MLAAHPQVVELNRVRGVLYHGSLGNRRSVRVVDDVVLEDTILGSGDGISISQMKPAAIVQIQWIVSALQFHIANLVFNSKAIAPNAMPSTPFIHTYSRQASGFHSNIIR